MVDVILAQRWSGLRRLVGLLGVVLALCLTGVAQAQQVRASLDSSRIGPGEAVTLTISVTGGQPEVPDLEGLADWQARYVGQETSFQSVNFNFTRTTSFNYLLTPLKQGNLAIPPILVRVDGQLLKTQPLKVKVDSGSAASGRGGLDPAGQPGGGVPGEDDVFVQAELEPRQVYVGQPIVQHLRIYTSVPTADQTRVGRGTIPGTIQEPIQDNVSSRTEEVNGRSYRVEEAVWVFYAVTSGPLTVPSMEVTVPVLASRPRRGRQGMNPLFDDFFGGMASVENRRFATEAQTLNVLPVPTQGRPDGFSGLVGRYTVEGQLSSQSLGLGDSTTLTVTVEGEGNLRDLQLQPLISADFKVYDDAPELTVEVSPDGRAVSRKVFKRALVPERSGDVAVPPMIVSFYNPFTRQFEQQSTRPYLLKVAPGRGGAQQVAAVPEARAGKEAVKVTGEDILPLHQGSSLETDQRVGLSSPLTLGLVLFPPLGFALVEAFRRVREKRNADPVLQRRRQAARSAAAALKQLEGKDERTQLEGLSRLFRGYLGDRLGVEGGALTSGEARGRLSGAGLPGALVEEVAGLMEALEAARYAPGGGQRSLESLRGRASELIKRLEKAWG